MLLLISLLAINYCLGSLQLLLGCHNKLVTPSLAPEQNINGRLLKKLFHQRSVYVKPDKVLLEKSVSWRFLRNLMSPNDVDNLLSVVYLVLKYSVVLRGCHSMHTWSQFHCSSGQG